MKARFISMFCAVFFALTGFAGWTLNEGVTSLTDGNWVIPVSGTRDALALSKPTANGGATTLDLTTGIEGGGTIVSIPTHFIHEASDAIRTSLVEVRLPESVTVIPGGAFWNCTALQKAVISTQATTINELAFGYCTALSTVEPFVPASVTNFGPRAFVGTSSLKKQIDLNLTNTTSIGNSSFAWNHSPFSNSGITSVDMSKSTITNIHVHAFRDMANLKTVYLPTNVVRIGSASFFNCKALTTVTPFFPDTVRYIGSSAFGTSTALTGDLVLRHPSLELASGGNWNETTFYGCKLTSADFSESGVTKIPNGFLRENTTLTSVKLPSTVTNIESAAFYGDTALKDVSFLSFPKFGTDVFGSNKQMPYARFTYPASNADWNSYVANNPSFVAWANAGGYQSTYNSTFADAGELVPAGYATVNGSSPTASGSYPSVKWLVPVPEVVKDVRLVIDGQPKVCVVSPAYGDQGTVTNFPVECTAPVEEIDGDIVYKCIGYRLGKLEGTEIVYGEIVPGTTCSFNKTEAGQYYVQWQWVKVAYRVTAAVVPSALGTVAITGSQYGAFDGFYETNATLTLTAMPVDGAKFIRWSGNVSSAQAETNPLSLTVDSAKTVTSQCAGPWTYADGVITDGAWTIPASGESDAIALGKPTANGGATVLDLTTGIVGGGTIVSIPVHFIHQASDAIRTSLVEVRLPESVTVIPDSAFWNCTALQKAVLSTQTTTIDERAFSDCTALTTVEPFVPASVTSFGSDAFARTSSLKQTIDLNLTNVTTLGGVFTWDHSPFVGSAVSGADMSQSTITAIGDNFFRGASYLATVKLPPNLESIGHAAFYGCSRLASVTPFFPASLKYLGWAAFNQTKALRGDLVVSNAQFQAVGILNPGITSSGYYEYKDSTFFQSGLDSADFSASRKMTYIPGAFLRECPNLKSVKFPKSLTLLGSGGCFYSDGNLKDIQFRSFPTNFYARSVDVLGSTFNYGRIVYQKGDAAARAYLDATTNAETFVAWNPDSAKAKEYLARFPDGWKPIGYLTIRKGSQYGENIRWMVPRNFGSGLAIILR